MANRTSFTVFALALTLGTATFAPLADAQHRPRRGHDRNGASGVSLDGPPVIVRSEPCAAPLDEDDDTTDEADSEAPAAPSAATSAVAPSAAPVGTTYGIFVGVSRYQGENDDLPGSAADAQHLSQSFRHAGWMEQRNAVVLTDQNATLDNVRQAFRTLAPRVNARDTLVFFFDGHGNQNDLDLRGADLSRRELGHLLDRVTGRSLLVLDSCGAGGFASVVRNHPGRAGLFSSRADEESSTAPAVNSGGWLAYNFRRAIDGGVARNPDGSMDFNDVVQYVERGYRAHDVDDQHLVATLGDRRGDFALGNATYGADEAEPADDAGDTDVADEGDDTQVAGNDPVEFPRIDRGGWATPAAQGLPLNAESFGQAVSFGAGLAGQMFEAFTK